MRFKLVLDSPPPGSMGGTPSSLPAIACSRPGIVEPSPRTHAYGLPRVIEPTSDVWFQMCGFGSHYPHWLRSTVLSIFAPYRAPVVDMI